MSAGDKVLYFNLKARGERVRMIYALAGLEFENILYTSENWPQAKQGKNGRLTSWSVSSHIRYKSLQLFYLYGELLTLYLEGCLYVS